MRYIDTKRWRVHFRIIFNRLGNVPKFILIGAQRSGTTTLFEHIVQHPKILRPLKKEVHFFDINYSKGYKWYLSHFPILKSENSFSGEATPYYFFHPLVPQRIKSFCIDMKCDIKFILILRNPVDRAISQYKFNCLRGIETLSFKDAIDAEEKRLCGEEERLCKNPDYNSYNYQKFSYLARGRYVEQLKRWFEYFSRKSFLIVSSEEFGDSPQETLSLIFEFLECEPFQITDLKRYNYTPDVSVCDESMRKYLEEYFRPYNEQLFKLIGRDLKWG